MSQDNVFDQEADKKKRDLRERLLRDRNRNDIIKVISKPEGRRVLWRILSEAGVFRGSFTGNETTFFNEGKRDIGLFLLREINAADLNAFGTMQREAASDKYLAAAQN